MPILKVSKNFQLTLPKEIRDNFNLSPGDHLQLEVEDDRMYLEPVKIVPIRNIKKSPNSIKVK